MWLVIELALCGVRQCFMYTVRLVLYLQRHFQVNGNWNDLSVKKRHCRGMAAIMLELHPPPRLQRNIPTN